MVQFHKFFINFSENGQSSKPGSEEEAVQQMLDTIGKSNLGPDSVMTIVSTLMKSPGMTTPPPGSATPLLGAGSTLPPGSLLGVDVKSPSGTTKRINVLTGVKNLNSKSSKEALDELKKSLMEQSNA